MKIPHISPILGKEEYGAVRKVLASGMLAQGEKVAEFEKEFADFCGMKYAVAVNSGTAALHCALYACGIGIGELDEVITTPFSFIATANSILMQRALPVFADIDPLTFNIDPQKIEEKITNKTRVILPVDLYGHIHDVEAIGKIAKKYGLEVIEDACQAHGAEFNSKKAGSFGNMGCFSFYATKNMTTGEGGMVVTNNNEYSESMRRFRQHGQRKNVRYQYSGLGFNYRMTDIVAAIGLEQLKKVDGFNKKRIRNATRLTKGLKGVNGLVTPLVKENYKHVFHQYTIRITDDFKMTRDELSQYLKDKGIGNSVFYPSPFHLIPHFGRLGHEEYHFPVAEKASQEVLSIPVHPLLAEKDIDYIIDTISNIWL